MVCDEEMWWIDEEKMKRRIVSRATVSIAGDMWRFSGEVFPVSLFGFEEYNRN